MSPLAKQWQGLTKRCSVTAPHARPNASDVDLALNRRKIQSVLRLLVVLTNRRNQNAPPVERISSTTAFAPLNNGSTVVIMSRKKAAASVAKC